ncbi:MAG TPA: response regulator [Verrucomicrobiae bacterium]|jgi:CheY-like chemotaxis protein|nr:response regulator [Verrucomicrobiae bacterium]
MANKIILYAEDNPDDMLILKMAFKRAGFAHALHCVDDGQEAICWLRGDNRYADRKKYPLPDLLILDLKMPKKSGFDVLEWLKEKDELKHLPVVVLSSSDDARDLKRTAALGVTKYLQKSALCEEVIGFLKTV